LIGRIVHAGALGSDAACLGDRGFRVPVLARVDDVAAPLVLGEFVSRGRRGASVLFDWEAPLGIPPRAGATHVNATLFTGSGEALVPRGLLLGTALLPTGPGPHSIEVEPGAPIESLGAVWVRLASAAEEAP
jgi:hypothetical protein